MFPDATIDETTATATTMGASFLFDFDIGEFVLKDGKVQPATALKATEVWIAKILKTEKFKFKIYENGETNEYGISLLDLVNSPYPESFIETEITREVTEALMQNTDIESVSGFVFTREKRGLTVAFTVSTIYGTTKSEVTI